MSHRDMLCHVARRSITTTLRNTICHLATRHHHLATRRRHHTCSASSPHLRGVVTIPARHRHHTCSASSPHCLPYQYVPPRSVDGPADGYAGPAAAPSLPYQYVPPHLVDGAAAPNLPSQYGPPRSVDGAGDYARQAVAPNIPSQYIPPRSVDGAAAPNLPSQYIPPRSVDGASSGYAGTLSIVPRGRLGNQMFQYAALYGLAAATGLAPFISPHMNISRVFELSLPVRDPPPKTSRDDIRVVWKAFDSALFRLQPQRDYVLLMGYTNSWLYFDHVRERVRREFTFAPAIRDRACAFLAAQRPLASGEPATYVGVHVRADDYRKWLANNRGLGADERYVHAAMDYFRGRYANALFVVCSDDIDWCKRHLATDRGDAVFSDVGHAAEVDLAVLSSCNHTIMTQGSFGWWAGYLAGGETLYFSDYFQPDARQIKLGFKYEYKYPPHWKYIAPSALPSSDDISKHNLGQ
ncbi:PREDICTED: galactoside 2-alpha-L-fucosyltransferase 2-like [Priapulus caudatus]|uniref:L-Fucosyltransferase n=1 Tax=Priapulus caudatus TaxID=37621 RepID=A0ABM1E8P0_PRICU|nr:PREDICTED: galactoside 2-alpha-L-fucosyltransferase 2-like [Priapulus caudatus]